MGKKLTSWERSQRRRERQAELDQNARRRAREREARAREREDERRQRQRSIAAEQAARQRAKERELEEIRQEAIRSVENYNAYVSNIQNIHKNEKFEIIFKAIDQLNSEHPFDESIYPKPKEPVKPELQFKAKEFKSKRQKDLDNLNLLVSYDISQYAVHIKKKITTFGKQFFWLILLLAFTFGLYQLPNLSWDFYDIKGVLRFASGFFAVLSFLKLFVLIQVSRGKDNNYATQKGFEKFIENSQSELTNIQYEIDNERKEFDVKEENRLKEANSSLQKELEKYNDEILPNYYSELKKWEQSVSSAKEAHKQNELIRKDWLSKVQTGDKLAMSEMCELILPIKYILDEDFINTDPSDLDIGYEVVSSELVRFCISLPSEYQFLPEYEIKMKPSGKEASEIINSETKQNDATNSVVAGASIGIVNLFFKILPTVQKIEIEASGVTVDKSTGDDKIDVLFTCQIERSDFQQIKLTNIDPVDSVKKLAVKYKSITSEREIPAMINRDDIFWSTENDEGVKINTYLKNLYTKFSLGENESPEYNLDISSITKSDAIYWLVSRLGEVDGDFSEDEMDRMLTDHPMFKESFNNAKSTILDLVKQGKINNELALESLKNLEYDEKLEFLVMCIDLVMTDGEMTDEEKHQLAVYAVGLKMDSGAAVDEWLRRKG